MASLFPRPLLGTRADAELYLARPAIDDQLRRAVARQRNTLVVGEPGSGRTSLLHAEARRLRERHQSVVYVDARALDDAAAIVRAVSRALEDEGHPPSGEDGRAAEADHPLLSAMRALPVTRETIVMVDDPRAADGFELFGRNRDRLWELDYVWVVATTPTGAAVLDSPPADAFFERRVEMFRLNASEKARLLATRAPEMAPSAVEALSVRGPDNLREFISTASKIVDGEVDPDRYARGVEVRQRRAAAISRSAGIAFDEVAALEPVSASDPRLLERLRWTKARASRVLNELEDAGLLVSDVADPQGPGRPPKLYRTRDAERFA